MTMISFYVYTGVIIAKGYANRRSQLKAKIGKDNKKPPDSSK